MAAYPEGGVDFGVAHSPYALLCHDTQMDFYNGMGVPYTFMGAAEMDAAGNVNATKFGDRPTGCGGLIDITQNAHHVIVLFVLYRARTGGRLLRRQGKHRQRRAAKKSSSKRFNRSLSMENCHAARAKRSISLRSARCSSCGATGQP